MVAAIAFTWWSWNRELGNANPQKSSASLSAPATPVLASAVREGSLELSSEYPGELDSDTSDLASKISGRLQQVTVRSGDRVKSGTVVAVVDDTDLQRQYEEVRAQVAVSKANRLRAEARLNAAQQELARMEQMFTEGLISTQAIESVRATAATLQAEVEAVEAQREQSEARLEILAQQISETKIAAPFNGVVSRRYLNPGTFVQPGTPIIRLVEAGPLRVRFWVPEEELAGMRPGVPVEVSTQSTSDSVFAGRVTRLSGEVNRQNRTVAVEGVLESRDPILLPGMYARVRVKKGRVAGKVVPGAAVLSRFDSRGTEEQGVFLASDGTARWVQVKVLGRSGDEIAVDANLADDDLVLVFGHQDLTNGAKIAIVEATTPGDGRTPGEETL
jgi:RND family efflux transporter MFP subunit